MFAVAFLALAGSALAAFTVDISTDVVRSASPITINWSTSEPADLVFFSIELVNTVFRNQFALANNVNPTQNSITLTLPVVPAIDGYTIQFVNIGDINDIYATTRSFSILDLESSSGSVTSTGSDSSSSSTDSATVSIQTTDAASSASSSSSSRTSTRSTSTSASASGSAEEAAATEPDAASTLQLSGFVGVLAGALAWIAL